MRDGFNPDFVYGHRPVKPAVSTAVLRRRIGFEDDRLSSTSACRFAHRRRDLLYAMHPAFV